MRTMHTLAFHCSRPPRMHFGHAARLGRPLYASGCRARGSPTCVNHDTQEDDMPIASMRTSSLNGNVENFCEPAGANVCRRLRSSPPGQQPRPINQSEVSSCQLRWDGPLPSLATPWRSDVRPRRPARTKAPSDDGRSLCPMCLSGT